MKQSLRLGRLAGIPIGLHWTVIVVLALITQVLGESVLPSIIARQAAITYWVMAVAGALLFGTSLLAHEVAHALVARRKGVRVRSITLWMLGGVTELDGEARTPSAELRIALAGPAASLAAAAIFAAAAFLAAWAGAPKVTGAALAWLTAANILLAVFNMLPGAPLDGGRVLKALLWRHYADRARADRAAGRTGSYLGIAIAVAGGLEIVAWRSFGGIWLILIGWFIATAASAEARAAGVRDAMAGIRVGDVMTPDPDVAPGWHTAADFADHVARHSRQSVFPVLNFAGELVGAVSRAQLARIRPDQRNALRLDRIATAIPPRYTAAPGDPAAPLFTRPPLAGQLAAVVVADGRVVGVVTTDDLRRALRMATPPTSPGSRSADGSARDGPPELPLARKHGHG